MIPKDTPNITLHLTTTKGAGDKMATLLQRGFLLPVSKSISILDLLCALPGFDESYIQERVQTIFVNGLAEDDTARLLTAGNTLALSAAMPGLAGAIFRRGGQHGSLRTRPQPAQAVDADQSGYITVKLFNMVAAETGPQILQTGVLIKGPVLARFLDRQSARILPVVQKAVIQGDQIQPDMLAGAIAGHDLVSLKMYA